jgi:hypothetical protein
MIKQLIKKLFFASLGVITSIPAILASTYFFKGCSKTDWILINQKLSVNVIFILVLIIFITSFILATYFFIKLIKTDMDVKSSDMRNAINFAVREAQTNNLKVVKNSDNDEDKA